MSINYIIASSSNALPRRQQTDKYSEYALQYHLQVILKLIETTTQIKQITIGNQIVSNPNFEYTNIQSLVNKIKEKGVAVVVHPLPAKGISYSQYIQCFRDFPNFDYYLIMEDDWCINTSYTSFDTFLLEHYKKAFPDNIGFLNAWSPRKGMFVGQNGGYSTFPYHSCITLGLLSKESVQLLLKENYPNSLGQLDFSLAISRANISILDFPQIGVETQILFWSTENGQILDYTESDSFVEPFFVPVQYYYKEARYNRRKDNTEYTVINTINLFNQ